MTQLAVRNHNGLSVNAGTIEPARPMNFQEMEAAAEMLAASGLFPVKTREQAFALMLLCDAEGLHPVSAMRRYHLIQGRPCMRSDAVQAEMKARGWLIRPSKRTAAEARATFAHPTYLPEGMELSVTYEQYKFLHNKDTWKQYPDDMLWARLMTKACRTLDPGVIVGIQTVEEANDTIYLESGPGQLEAMDAHAATVIATAETKLPGQVESGPDTRAYRAIVKAAAAAVDCQPLELYKHLAFNAVQRWPEIGVMPQSLTPAIEMGERLYRTERDWVRSEIARFATLRAELAAAEEDSQASDSDPDCDYPDEPGANG